ncbi:Phosphoglycerol transferase [Bifidobacterium cuniculi]|uniref:Phosphoglycerol transferase n=2 Tax=Bifidobacterium cuniculi TaxID=1688 RepID=A0A087AZS5_9BIFI|nr:LTA synthase family protein [Bifidobacterium cuniculi]KFI64275.1 Phosphoglycerol transferase [Bifidobacterium cuniculi]
MSMGDLSRNRELPEEEAVSDDQPRPVDGATSAVPADTAEDAVDDGAAVDVSDVDVTVDGDAVTVAEQTVAAGDRAAAGSRHGTADNGIAADSVDSGAADGDSTADTTERDTADGADGATPDTATSAVTKRRRLHAPAWWRHYRESKFYQVWNKRPKWSYGSYGLVALVVLAVADLLVLWSMNMDAKYDPEAGWIVNQVFLSELLKLSSLPGFLNFIALALVYLICVTLINRFWVGTAVFGAIAGVYAFANKVKVTMRNEPVIPSDLGFLTGGGGGEDVASFITETVKPTVNAGVALVVWFVVLCVLMQFVDRRRAFIHCSWRRPLRPWTNGFGLVCRILAPILSICLLVSYAGGLGEPTSATRAFLREFGYQPTLWNVLDDAKSNGALTTFLSLTDVKAMDDEPDYSKETMAAINSRYAKLADEVNQERTQQLTDSTVIMVLSETFSDPNRVPNVHFDIDPMPFIRSLKGTTTSGLMLSPGYGGGTANIEFQQMTGLSMANFSASMLSPYQQLVATRPKMFSFNQMWNEACGGDTSCSVGFHPFLQRFYLRGVNYRKFGFSHLYTLDSDPKITHADTYEGAVAKSSNVSDEQAYLNVLDEVKANAAADKPAQFIELVTMQNHAPYPDLYGATNEFHAANKTTDTPGGEMGVIAEYAKGLQLTDQATEDFLEELDAIDEPITVVFYGDHLPGIYTTAAAKDENSLTLHETDYFIWSNQASSSHDVKLPESDAAYTSSNFFMAQAAQQMNARISPYLALLTKLHQEVPAMSRSVTSGGVWNTDGSVTLLDSSGNPIDEKDLSDEAKQLLKDYKLVQYDMTVGDNYLMDDGFMALPKQ